MEEFGVLFVEAFSSYLLQLAHIRNSVGNSVVDIELNINNTKGKGTGFIYILSGKNIDVVSIWFNIIDKEGGSRLLVFSEENSIQ